MTSFESNKGMLLAAFSILLLFVNNGLAMVQTNDSDETPSCEWNNTNVDLKPDTSATGTSFRCNISTSFTVTASGVDALPGLNWVIELYNSNDNKVWTQVISQKIVGDVVGIWGYQSSLMAPVGNNSIAVMAILLRSPTYNMTVEYKSQVNMVIKGQGSTNGGKSLWWIGILIAVPVGLTVGYFVHRYRKRRNHTELI